MKKLFIVTLMVLLTASVAYAEQSAQTYSGNSTQRYWEQQVFVDAYNNSGSPISSNYVVILDTSGSGVASGTTLGTYITTTTSSYSTLVLGVTDATIPAGSVGRVCVRGPHKCYLVPAPSSIGATLTTTTVAGAGAQASNAANGAIFGKVLSTGKIANGSPTGTIDGFTTGDGVNNYWVWVGELAAN